MTSAPYEPTVRDTLIEAPFASGSDLVLLIQDPFGRGDRIKEPATVGGDNRTFRLP